MLILETPLPTELYKLVSPEQFADSQGADSLKLSEFDSDFIHFCEKDQIKKIADKFFAKFESVSVLKIDPSKLSGRLVKESNPGGSTEYYHLYDGIIPMGSILEFSETNLLTSK